VNTLLALLGAGLVAFLGVVFAFALALLLVVIFVELGFVAYRAADRRGYADSLQRRLRWLKWGL
jgi:hypothetical protein